MSFRRAAWASPSGVGAVDESYGSRTPSREPARCRLARERHCRAPFVAHPVARVSYYNSTVEIHPSARRHGIADEDIEHAVAHAMTIDDQEDDTRLYLGPARSADLLEVVTIVRADGSELAIHAMNMRSKYQRLLPGG